MSKLEELKRLDADATDGPWTPAWWSDDEKTGMTPEAFGALMERQAKFSCNDRHYHTMASDERGVVITSVSGNGEDAQWNAALIAMLRNDAPAMIEAMEFAVCEASERLDGYDSPDDHARRNRARAIVAKFEG